MPIEADYDPTVNFGERQMEKIPDDLQAVLDGKERRQEPDRRTTRLNHYVTVERRHDTRDRRGGWPGTLKSLGQFIASVTPGRKP